MVEILTNYVRKTFDRSTKVLDFHHPHQLLEGIEGFNLELCDQPESLEQILVDCRDTLKYGVRTGTISNHTLEICSGCMCESTWLFHIDDGLCAE